MKGKADALELRLPGGIKAMGYMTTSETKQQLEGSVMVSLPGHHGVPLKIHHWQSPVITRPQGKLPGLGEARRAGDPPVVLRIQP